MKNYKFNYFPILEASETVVLVTKTVKAINMLSALSQLYEKNSVHLIVDISMIETVENVL